MGSVGSPTSRVEDGPRPGRRAPVPWVTLWAVGAILVLLAWLGREGGSGPPPCPDQGWSDLPPWAVLLAWLGFAAAVLSALRLLWLVKRRGPRFVWLLAPPFAVAGLALFVLGLHGKDIQLLQC